MTSNKKSPAVTADDIKKWLGSKTKLQLSDVEINNLAIRITRMWRPGDPESYPDPGIVAEDIYRVFKAATKAVKLLLEDMPKMLRHWDGLQWAPGTPTGYPAIKALQEALRVASPYIKEPFGPRGLKRRRVFKIWHSAAISVAILLTDAAVKSGKSKPSFTRNSASVRVVLEAIQRKKYPGAQMATKSAIATFLTRRYRIRGQ